MMPTKVFFLFALLTSLHVHGAAFRHQRPVYPNGKGPQRLEADLPLLGGAASDLRDVRLLDKRGQEVPYVLVPPATAKNTWRAGRLLPLPATKTQSGFELDLGEAVRTRKLKVEGLTSPFLKRFRLEGSGDRSRWTQLVEDGTLFDLPDEGLHRLQVDLPEGDYRYLRLVWDDSASAKMALPQGAAVEIRAPGVPPPLAPLQVIARPGEPGISRFTVGLPGPRLPITALLLSVPGTTPLLRQARVTEGRMQSRGLAPRELGRAQLLRIQRQGASAFNLRIPIESPEGTELELRVEDGNNPPLTLSQIQAEWTPQPWIYFESDGEPLTAHFGDTHLAAPRYDLAALSEQLQHAKAATAHWGAPSMAAPTVTQSLYDPGPGASLAPARFKTQRTIPNAEPGLVALLLDPHVLAHRGGLSDLRLLDNQNRQIPYLLEERDAPLSVPLVLPARQANGRTSTYLLDLPEEGIGEARVVLEAKGQVFHRTVRLLEASRRAGAWHTLAEATWHHQQPDMPPSPLILAFRHPNTKQVLIEINEGDNQPLALLKATLLLPGWRMRFFHPGQEVRLLYDGPFEKPEYDLALLSDRLLTAPAREITFQASSVSNAPAQAVATPAPAATSGTPKLFWIALAASVVILLGLLVKMIRTPDAPPPPEG